MNTSTMIEIDLDEFSSDQIINYLISLIKQGEVSFTERGQIMDAINGDQEETLRDESYDRLFDWIRDHKSVSETEAILGINHTTLDY